MALEFYEEKDGKIMLKQDLFTTIAEDKATTLVKNYYSKENKGKRNNPTQIRRFYDEIVTFSNNCEMLIKNTDSDKKESVFQQQLPMIKMLIPKVRYAWARELVCKDFVELITDSISNLKTYENLKVFSSFFEAVIGHFKYHMEVDKEAFNNKNNTNTIYGNRGGNFSNNKGRF